MAEVFFFLTKVCFLPINHIFNVLVQFFLIFSEKPEKNYLSHYFKRVTILKLKLAFYFLQHVIC